MTSMCISHVLEAAPCLVQIISLLSHNC